MESGGTAQGIKYQPGSLFVHNDKGQQTQIPCLEVSEVQCTMDVQIAPDGNTLTELCYLVLVANEWHDKMARSWLPSTRLLLACVR